MSDLAALVRRYINRYNSNNVEGMLDCCADGHDLETITNPGGMIRLNGKIEMREIIEATTRAFRERRHEVVSILVDRRKSCGGDCVFRRRGDGTGTARPARRAYLGSGDATMFEQRDNKLARICDYS